MLQQPPAFAQIKSCILTFYKQNLKEINDGTNFLQILCEALECSFRLGLKRSYSLRRQDYWCWMKSLIRKCSDSQIFLHPLYLTSVAKVEKNCSVSTTQGRGRLLIRMLLQHGLLDFLSKLLQSCSNLATAFYDETGSILGNEILVQIFCSLLSELSRIPFNLELENSEFLDETWKLPLFKTFEFVPCKMLGARVETIDGHHMVTELNPNGVAAEDNRICVGDIFSSMYGCSLSNSGIHLASLRSQHYGEPVPVGVTKVFLEDGQIYPPIKLLLERCGYSQLLGKIKPVPLKCESTDDFFKLRPYCQFRFIGKYDVGSDGGVQMINQSIMQAILNFCISEENVPVSIELGELGVTVWKLAEASNNIIRSEEPLFKHSYPQISSCGRRTDNTNFFAYIAGDEPCTLAKHFTSYVFEAVNHSESKRLIAGLSMGFDRTHWTL